MTPFRAVLALAVGLAGSAPPPAAGSNGPPKRITEAECERLVEQLVTPGKPPSLPKYGNDLPEGVKGVLEKKQAKIAKAYEALSDNIEVALPVLVKHADDQRFSYVYQDPYSGAYDHADVATACWSLILQHVEVHGRYTTRNAGANGAPRSPSFIEACGGIAKWWQRRKGKPLAELQLEAVEWALRQPKPEFFDSRAEWATAKRHLRRMAHDLRASRTPIVVHSRLEFFCK